MKKRTVLIIIGLLVAIVAVLGVLEATNVINILGASKKTTQSAGQSTKGEPESGSSQSSTDNGGNTSDSGQQESAQKTTANAGTSQNLLVPRGNFVSNHNPNLSGKPAPNTEGSVCNTTPGAKCQIIFTKGSTSKSLPTRTTDSNGSAFWSWKLQDYGITAGSWTITAKATLGSQTKTSADALKLNVGQ